MYTKLPIVLMTSAVLLFAAVSSAYPVFAQFDITTEQSPQDQQAVITVKLATNNTVVIPPNGTIIEVPGNVTVIDNTTVVVTPDNSTVTELPGNVTVISPPEPEPCQCPAANATEQPSGIEPVIVQPAPGQQVITENGTQLITNESQTEPIRIPPPSGDGNQTASNNTGPTLPVEPDQPTDNQTIAPGSNETQNANGGGNDTSLSPAAFAQRVPWPSLSNIVAS